MSDCLWSEFSDEDFVDNFRKNVAREKEMPFDTESFIKEAAKAIDKTIDEKDRRDNIARKAAEEVEQHFEESKQQIDLLQEIRKILLQHVKNGDLADALRESEHEVHRLKKTIEEFKQTVSDAQEREREAQRQLKLIREKCNRQDDAIDGLKLHLNAKKIELEESNRMISDLHDRIEMMKRQLANQGLSVVDGSGGELSVIPQKKGVFSSIFRK